MHETSPSRSITQEVERVFVPNEYYELKTRIHDRLIDLIDLSLIDSVDTHVLKSEIRGLVQKILQEEENGIPLNLSERERTSLTRSKADSEFTASGPNSSTGSMHVASMFPTIFWIQQRSLKSKRRSKRCILASVS